MRGEGTRGSASTIDFSGAPTRRHSRGLAGKPMNVEYLPNFDRQNAAWATSRNFCLVFSAVDLLVITSESIQTGRQVKCLPSCCGDILLWVLKAQDWYGMQPIREIRLYASWLRAAKFMAQQNRSGSSTSVRDCYSPCSKGGVSRVHRRPLGARTPFAVRLRKNAIPTKN